MTQQIRTAYVIGKQEYTKLLLNQEDPAAVGRVMRYYKYFHLARNERVELAKQTLNKLRKVEDSIQQKTRDIKRTRKEQLEHKKELEKKSKERSLVLVKLSSDLKDKTGVLKRLLEDERRLQRLVQDLDKAIPDILTAPGGREPFAKLKGQLNWPTQGKVKALFGKSRKVGRLKWNGIIIKASEGKNVRAISHGRVAYADWLRGYGMLMIIDHGDGYMSLYGHNQALYKETGEWVEAGDLVASVGSTGGQQSAGLYFEIRHNGKPSNPTRWCRSRNRG